MLSTLPDEDTLMEKSARHSWNAMINMAVDSIDRADREEGTARCTAINRLSTSYMGRREIRIMFVRMQAALNWRV